MPRVSALCVFLPALVGVEAAAQGRISLRNCMDPALVTTHEITLTLARRTLKQGKPQDSVIKLHTRLRRMHLEESNPGSVKVADLLVSRTPEVVSVRLDGKPVEPPPRAETFNLPLGTTQLYTKTQSLQDGPMPVPLTKSVERTLASLLLDVAHWPRESADVGHRWSRTIATEDFEGTQSFELVDATTVAGEAVLVLDLRVDGKFAGTHALRYEFDRARARYMWSRGQRVLMQLQGKAEYRRLRDGGSDAQALSAEVRLMRRDRLEEEQQQSARKALNDFALASSEFQAGHFDKAVAACAAFRQKWPDSPWMPALDDVEQHALSAARQPKLLDRAALTRVLTSQMARWNEVDGRDEDQAARVRAALAEIGRSQEAELRKMLKDKDESVRALAVFAWSFGESPDHLVTVLDAVRDSSPKVRAWAAQALAARGDPLTEPDALRKLLADPDATVRARACAAVARCYPHGEPLTGRLRDLLHKAARDSARLARIEAARTFGQIGGPADVAPLRTTLESEKDPAVREALVRAIKEIEKRAKP